MDIEILSPDRLRYWADRADFPSGAVDALVDLAADISADPDLLEIFEEFHEATAERGEWMREYKPLPMHPLVLERMGERANLFYLLAYLAAMPYVYTNYSSLGIEEQVFDDTMKDIGIWLRYASDLRGRWTFEEFPWIWMHLDSRLFSLGRLQYVLKPFDSGITALRGPGGRVVILADPHLSLRDDGCAYAAGDNPPAGEPWQPVFEETTAGWRGCPVHPDGYALREPVFLPRDRWTIALRRGDTVLDMHIPAEGAFNVETCRDSLRRAWEFFPRHFPENPFRAGYCHTWFFTPQLAQMLPPTSNIIRFQREFYRFPHPGKLGFLWRFAFGERYPDRTTAPRDTSLRRAVLEHLDAGGEVFDLPGLLFHGPEEWGRQPEWNEASQPLE